MPEENSYEDFERRFGELQSEALSYGISSVSVIYESDPLHQREFKTLTYQGGPILCAGLAGYAQNRLLNRPSDA